MGSSLRHVRLAPPGLTRAGTWLLLIAMGAGAGYGCSATKEDPTRQGSSSTGQADPGAADPSDAPADALEDGSSACLRAQQRSALKLSLGGAFDLVTAATNGDSPRAAGWVQSGMRQLSRQVAKSCDGSVPGELDAFVDTVSAATGGPRFGTAQVKQIRSAWRGWARTVGVKPAEIEEFRDEAACQRLVREVNASYRVLWRWEGAEKGWWIELTWDNRVGEAIWVQYGGDARVRGFAGRSEDWYRKAPGGGVVATWGGGSAEIGPRPAGHSQETVAPSPEPRTNADGALEVLTFYAVISHGRLRNCALTVSSQP